MDVDDLQEEDKKDMNLMGMFRWFFYANGAGIAVAFLTLKWLGDDDLAYSAALWTGFLVYCVGIVRWLWKRHLAKR